LSAGGETAQRRETLLIGASRARAPVLR